MKLESDVVRNVLGTLGPMFGIYVERINTGAVTFCVTCRAAFPPAGSQKFLNGYHGPCKYCGGDARRLVHFGVKGAPDIRAIVRAHDGRGLFLGIEAKSDTGRQRPDQKSWQLACEAAGGVYLIARDGADAKAVVERIRGGGP